MATRNFTLKRKVNNTTYDVLYPKTTWAQVEGKPSTFTPTGHSLDSHSGLLSISKLSTGVNGQVIKMVSGVPTWSSDSNNNTWRPVVDNLTSTSTTSSLSANQGRLLKNSKVENSYFQSFTDYVEGMFLDIYDNLDTTLVYDYKKVLVSANDFSGIPYGEYTLQRITIGGAGVIGGSTYITNTFNPVKIENNNLYLYKIDEAFWKRVNGTEGVITSLEFHGTWVIYKISEAN